MQEHEENSREAQLREAAEALVGWVHQRRATWTSEPLEIAPPSLHAASPAPLAYAPAATSDAPVWEPRVELDEFQEFDLGGVSDPEPVTAEVEKPEKTAFRPRVPTAAIRSFGAAIAGAGARLAPLAPVAAVVGALAIGGWFALPYVGTARIWLTQLTQTATSSPKPKPEAAAAAPSAAARGAGQLTVRSEPAGAKVLVDGRERGVTPLTLNDVAVGSHTVVIESEKGSVKRTVRVAADRPVLVSESIFAGWLTVFAPFELEISEGTRTIRLDENNKVLLAPGPHELRFENPDLGYRETRHVEVQPGQTASVSLVAAPSTLTVTASGPATVSIDGQQVGETPLTNHAIALGTRDIVVKGADGSERRFTRRVTVAPVQIDVDFSKP